MTTSINRHSCLPSLSRSLRAVASKQSLPIRRSLTSKPIVSQRLRSPETILEFNRSSQLCLAYMDDEFYEDDEEIVAEEDLDEDDEFMEEVLNQDDESESDNEQESVDEEETVSEEAVVAEESGGNAAVAQSGCPKGFTLSFLWLEKYVAIAVDQRFGRDNLCPLTEYFVWPRTDAWEELQQRLSENPWIDQTDQILLLNRATEVINFWQDEEKQHSLEEAQDQFPDCVFLGA